MSVKGLECVKVPADPACQMAAYLEKRIFHSLEKRIFHSLAELKIFIFFIFARFLLHFCSK